ncbi:hypothetical protein [Amycolatopsis nigrescens]|uniref:hypothetical protein n=1 Tax=Amycolatopsis nigrescens TaxID=381445 RepID=UPI00037833F0|nr:hypothetical protein [Amycolatopsis nigrescens]
MPEPFFARVRYQLVRQLNVVLDEGRERLGEQVAQHSGNLASRLGEAGDQAARLADETALRASRLADRSADRFGDRATRLLQWAGDLLTDLGERASSALDRDQPRSRR